MSRCRTRIRNISTETVRRPCLPETVQIAGTGDILVDGSETTASIALVQLDVDSEPVVVVVGRLVVGRLEPIRYLIGNSIQDASQ